jgi:hypothetical protein
VNGFSCSCLGGYSGNACQFNINECASAPCQNGATCVDAVNSFSCAWSASLSFFVVLFSFFLSFLSSFCISVSFSSLFANLSLFLSSFFLPF